MNPFPPTAQQCNEQHATEALDKDATAGARDHVKGDAKMGGSAALDTDVGKKKKKEKGEMEEGKMETIKKSEKEEIKKNEKEEKHESKTETIKKNEQGPKKQTSTEPKQRAPLPAAQRPSRSTLLARALQLAGAAGQPGIAAAKAEEKEEGVDNAAFPTVTKAASEARRGSKDSQQQQPKPKGREKQKETIKAQKPKQDTPTKPQELQPPEPRVPWTLRAPQPRRTASGTAAAREADGAKHGQTLASEESTEEAFRRLFPEQFHDEEIQAAAIPPSLRRASSPEPTASSSPLPNPRATEEAEAAPVPASTAKKRKIAPSSSFISRLEREQRQKRNNNSRANSGASGSGRATAAAAAPGINHNPRWISNMDPATFAARRRAEQVAIQARRAAARAAAEAAEREKREEAGGMREQTRERKQDS